MLEIAINRWAFPPDMPYREVFRLAKETGFEAVEVTTTGGELTPDTPEKGVRAVAEAARDAGVSICGCASGEFWTHGVTVSDQRVREKGMDICRKLLQQAVWLGTDAILFIPGWVSVPWNPEAERVPYETARQRALAALKELAPDAERLDVTIGVENVWNGMLLSPIEFRDFLNEVGSLRVRAYFDTGNAIPFAPPEDWVRILGSRVCRVHIKDFRRAVGNLSGFVPPLEGDVNWPAVMRMMFRTGYSGPLTAERSPVPFAQTTILRQTAIALSAIRDMAKG
jgi:hexulose-6-phosphate isomerase